MNLSAWQNGRRLVPRWRSFATTLRAGELSSPKQIGPAAPVPPDLMHRLEMFNLTPGLVTAAEAVEAAIVSGRDSDAVDAARRLVSIDDDAAPLIKEQAWRLLSRTGNLPKTSNEIELKPRPDAASWRRLTRIHPHDPVAWVELSLEQTIRRQKRAALRSMSVALHLAPYNRFVVRSAARLHLHLEDPERAHDLVARNLATRSDPWLMAAEIALAAVASRSPRFLKTGLETVEESGLGPHQITELAGAVGTEVLLSGNRKRSRRMFVKSMAEPTGNALAQGEWAAPHFGAEFVLQNHLDTVPEAFEAKALHLYREGRLAEVPEVCEEWATADPFSIRPLEFGATTASIIEEYSCALSLAQRGLAIRPDAAKLLNSAAFSLASIGRLDEAEGYIKKIPKHQDDIISNVTLANKGLIAYRRGRNLEARRLYTEAIDGFKRSGHPLLSAKARLYLARESIRANEADSEAMLAHAKDLAKPFEKTDLRIILNSIEQHFSEKERRELGTPADSSLPRADLKDLKWSTPGLPPQYQFDVLKLE